MSRAGGQLKCEGCAESCAESCGDRKSYQYGPGKVLRATYEPDAYADANQIADDDEYAREFLAREDRFISQYGNWILSFKAAPYGSRDFMVFIDKTNGRRVEGIRDLSDRDMRDFFVMAGKLKSAFEEKYPNSHFVIGINRGDNQSLKRIHFHVTDISEADDPSDGKEVEHVRARIASKVRPYRATVFAFSVARAICPGAYMEGGVIKVPMSEDFGGDMLMLRLLADRFEETLKQLNGEWGMKDIWSYSMLIDKNGGDKEVVSIAFFDRKIGCTDIGGVALNRVKGETPLEVLEIREDLARCVQEAVGNIA